MTDAYEQGIAGRPFGFQGSVMVHTNFDIGPNQDRLSTLSMMPSIANAQTAYEVGRVLRCMANIFDQYDLSHDMIAEAVEIVIRGAAAHKGYNSKFAAKDLAHHFIKLFSPHPVTETELQLKLRAYAGKQPEFGVR